LTGIKCYISWQDKKSIFNSENITRQQYITFCTLMKHCSKMFIQTSLNTQFQIEFWPLLQSLEKYQIIQWGYYYWDQN